MSSFWGDTEQSPTSWRSQPSLRHGSKPERGWDRAKPPPGTELSLSPPQLFLPHRITCRARFKQNKISCHGYPEQDCYIYKEREKYRKYIRGAASHAFFFFARALGQPRREPSAAPRPPHSSGVPGGIVSPLLLEMFPKKKHQSASSCSPRGVCAPAGTHPARSRHGAGQEGPVSHSSSGYLRVSCTTHQIPKLKEVPGGGDLTPHCAP